MENSNVENNESNWKDELKSWQIACVYCIMPFYAVFLAVKWTLKFIWQMFFAIPRVPKRFYGFLRLVSCAVIWGIDLQTGAISDFGGQLIKSEHMFHNIVGVGMMVFMLYVFFINFLLGVLMIFGFHINGHDFSGLGESSTNQNSNYKNIDSAMSYIDTKMAFKTDMQKVEYMKDIFGGRK